MSNWLKYSPTSGHGNATITLSASTLTDLEDRIATLIATGSQEGQTLSATTVITQKHLILEEIYFENLIWSTDVAWGGGTATSANCSFSIIAKYSDNSTEDITNKATISGSLTVSATTATTRQSVGTLTLTATYGDKTCTGSVEVYQEEFNPLKEPLTFKIISGGTIVWKSADTSIAKTISYSKDNGDTWTNITANENGTNISVNLGDVIIFKGDNSRYASGLLTYNAFQTTGETLFSVQGNIMSLIDSTGFATAETLTDSYTFCKLFYGCIGLVSAENLILPATALTDSCYHTMFYNCVSLTAAPALPANTLVDSCYSYIFLNCTSLKTAPELPATTLAYECYRQMFQGCTSLKTAPVLPATTLADWCYSEMFASCTSLKTAPELPATALTEYCYWSMFDGCSSLTTAPALPATTLAEGCYGKMFYYCTSLTTAPVLPATTLATYCYRQMFMYCTSLKTAPVLPSTTLAGGCYEEMFRRCSSLNYIKCLARNISVSSCTGNWVEGVASYGIFVKNPYARDWETGSSGIPEGWTVQNDSAGDTGNVQLNLSGGLITLGTDCSANFNSPSTAFTINGLGICGLNGDTNIDILGESTYMFSLVRQEDLSAITITYDWSHDSITYLNAAVLVLNFDNGTTSKTANISYNNGFSSTVVDLRDYFTPNATSNVNLTINASIV